MVDDQQGPESEETRPSVDEAMSDASGDTAKTPDEADAPSQAADATGSDTAEPIADDELGDAESDTTKSP